MKSNKTIEAEFFYGATPAVFEKARQLRNNMTDAEVTLWNRIRRGNINNCHFRRQHPINKFIADFYCHEKRLVIEVDGSIHLTEYQKERDEGRDYFMETLGLTVLRFSNKMVLNDITKVVEEIRMASSARVV